ncbi:ABC transporter ATP-binding protein [Pararhodospirillum oryzae]|uniref:ABC transporter n=1 Tax=Pararhodospirillum oryzae TaxID=478448 RepID=A0A512H5S6_9PROT|nr:ABC transporter ATP-binding protein [Pararhodospirillum oryzae]GEO80774.1 ABC transporter [Pararhodospirillum oryzae]
MIPAAGFARIDLENVGVVLDGRPVLANVTASLGAPGLVGLIGPNGAGKTTLLRALAGLVASQGRVLMNGQPLARLSPAERARQVAYLAQERAVHWPLSVREVVALGRLPHRGQGHDDQAAIDRALDETGVRAFADRPIGHLSGGERARVLLARALAVEAPVLLADEPVAALDPHHQLAMMGLLRRHAEAGALVMVVVHDLISAARFCHRLILLDRGGVVADGPPDAVLTEPTLATHYRVRAVFPQVGTQALPLAWETLGP